MLIWRATNATQEKIYNLAIKSADNTVDFPYGGIINFANDFDAVSYWNEINQNSALFSFRYYDSEAAMPVALACQQVYENGEVKTAYPYISSVFDNGDGTTTPAEYEWTAYYWDE